MSIPRYLPFRISTDKPIPIFDRRGRERGSAQNDKRLLGGATGQDAVTYVHNRLLDNGVPEGNIDDEVILADLEVRSVTEGFWQEFKRRSEVESGIDRDLFHKRSRVILQKLGITPQEFRMMAHMVREVLN